MQLVPLNMILNLFAMSNKAAYIPIAYHLYAVLLSVL